MAYSTYSSTDLPGNYQPSQYQPSVLELAQRGNFRAIAHWLNSILVSQGIHVQAEAPRAGCLKIMVNLQQTRTARYLVAAIGAAERHRHPRNQSAPQSASSCKKSGSETVSATAIVFDEPFRLGRIHLLLLANVSRCNGTSG